MARVDDEIGCTVYRTVSCVSYAAHVTWYRSWLITSSRHLLICRSPSRSRLTSSSVDRDLISAFINAFSMTLTSTRDLWRQLEPSIPRLRTTALQLTLLARLSNAKFFNHVARSKRTDAAYCYRCVCHSRAANEKIMHLMIQAPK